MANVSSTTSSTNNSTAAIDALAKTVEGALVGVIGTMQKIVTESAAERAAERAADRKKVIGVDFKTNLEDLANYKVDKNAEELAMLLRNDATREVELKYLKLELRLLQLVMIAVVAYLWWIGHA